MKGCGYTNPDGTPVMVSSSGNNVRNPGSSKQQYVTSNGRDIGFSFPPPMTQQPGTITFGEAGVSAHSYAQPDPTQNASDQLRLLLGSLLQQTPKQPTNVPPPPFQLPAMTAPNSNIVLEQILNQAAEVQGNLCSIVNSLGTILRDQQQQARPVVSPQTPPTPDLGSLLSSLLLAKQQQTHTLQNFSDHDVDQFLQSISATSSSDHSGQSSVQMPTIESSSENRPLQTTRPRSGSADGTGRVSTLRSLLVDPMSIPREQEISSEPSSPTCSPTSSHCNTPASHSGSENSAQTATQHFFPAPIFLQNDQISEQAPRLHIGHLPEIGRKAISDTGSSKLHRQQSQSIVTIAQQRKNTLGHHRFSTGSMGMISQDSHSRSNHDSPGESMYPNVKQRRFGTDSDLSLSTNSSVSLSKFSTSRGASKRNYGTMSASPPRDPEMGPSFTARRIPRLPSLGTQCPSAVNDLKLRIVHQPEEQHRARYMTEGSRGAIKDRSGVGYPAVQLTGWNQPCTLQVFVSTESGRINPHGYYQACKVSGKHSYPCKERNFDSTNVIEIHYDCENDTLLSVDCVGILKLRNADVEQRGNPPKSKKKSTRARLAFRVNLPSGDGTFVTLQCASEPIHCTQPVGSPEISRMSLTEGSCLGNTDLFIIGRNFTRGTRVLFQQMEEGTGIVWEREANVDMDFFQQTHLISKVPPYMNADLKTPITVQVVVTCNGRFSEPHYFTYLPESKSKMISDSLHSLTLSPNALNMSAFVSPEALHINQMATEQHWISVSSCENTNAFNPHYPEGKALTSHYSYSSLPSVSEAAEGMDAVINRVTSQEADTSCMASSSYSKTGLEASYNIPHSLRTTAHGRNSDSEMEWSKTGGEATALFLTGSLDTNLSSEFMMSLGGSMHAETSTSTLTESTDYHDFH